MQLISCNMGIIFWEFFNGCNSVFFSSRVNWLQLQKFIFVLSVIASKAPVTDLLPLVKLFNNCLETVLVFVCVLLQCSDIHICMYLGMYYKFSFKGL